MTSNQMLFVFTPWLWAIDVLLDYQEKVELRKIIKERHRGLSEGMIVGRKINESMR